MGISKEYQELKTKAEKISRTNLDTLISGEVGTGRDWFVSFISGEVQPEKIDSRDYKLSFELLKNSPKKEIFHFSQIEYLDSEGQQILNRATEKRDLQLGNMNFKVKRFFFSSDLSLPQKVKDGKFRDDLYRKISTIQLVVPSLRERKEDISYYTNIFLEEICKKHRRKIPILSDEFIQHLQERPWLGNLSELKALLESMVLFHKGRSLEVKQIPQNFNTPILPENNKIVPGVSLDYYEREIIKVNLIHTNGNRKKTAESLGISERNLYRKIKIYKLE